jgi:argininosuccinate lyase
LSESSGGDPAATGKPVAMWGGRFEGQADELFRAVNDSLGVDWELVQQDIRGSIAWAHAIGGAGVLTPDEVSKIESALKELAKEAAAVPSPPLSSGAEDVHSWVEQELTKRVGPLGKKLHTGRSRNDQVATDLRLWVVEQCDARVAEVRAFQRALVALGTKHAADPIPGYTHLQRAQPVTIGHWALAYVEMLARDIERLESAKRMAARSPLGSAALAGTTFPVDRVALASRLGFSEPTRNSLDAVSDRDFALDVLHAASLCAMHLSRLAEEMIIFATGEFAFITLDDSVTSGSSLMPQKKNPDALELIRAGVGRALGNYTNLLTLLKGLTLAYNKDMQEDKPPVFDSMKRLSLLLRIAARVIERTTFNLGACERAAKGGHANSTELADYLVEKGIPFRDAHEVAGRLVREALAKDCALEDLPIETFKALHPQIENDVYARLTLESVLARRDVLGGTAPTRVRDALSAWRSRLGMA